MALLSLYIVGENRYTPNKIIWPIDFSKSLIEMIENKKENIVPFLFSQNPLMLKNATFHGQRWLSWHVREQCFGFVGVDWLKLRNSITNPCTSVSKKKNTKCKTWAVTDSIQILKRQRLVAKINVRMLQQRHLIALKGVMHQKNIIGICNVGDLSSKAIFGNIPTSCILMLNMKWFPRLSTVLSEVWKRSKTLNLSSQTDP